jgi:hypothetical protein
MPITLPNGRTVGLFEPVHLRLPISKDTADAQALFKLPDGVTLALERLWWEITTAFTGGTNAAIGASSDNASYNTKGNLLGGAGGDVLATLVQGKAIGGTVGAKFGSNGVVVLVPGNVIRFDRIVDAFTAGAGYVNVLARQLSA